MLPATESKLSRLRDIISGYKNVMIGFSGGVDSSLLLKVAADTIGPQNVKAVTADSESLQPEELRFCRRLAEDLCLPPGNFIELKTEELSNPDYRNNPVDRCYYCKSELFGKMAKLASELGVSVILDGSNADDLDDWRPGRKAASELGVISPLAEAGITKSELREMAREFRLPNWDKPAMACLSSRIPYGSEITVEKLERISLAESYLRSLGFSQLRVRHHDKTARIELLPAEMPKLFDKDLYSQVAAKLKSLGFTYVAVDLQGYRSGSMNEEIITKGE